MPSERDIVVSAIEKLNTRGKRLLRFYMTLPFNQFEKQVEKMGDKYHGTSNLSLRNEYQKENEIIQLAYRAKQYKLNVPKGGGKSRRQKKRGEPRES